VAKFLIDANLPYYFKLWNTPNFIHVLDLDDSCSDEFIWQHAKENGLTIVSKDSDFSSKLLLQGSPPKVIHLKFGNLRMKEFHQHISQAWPLIEIHIETHSLINVYRDKLELIK